MPDAHPECLSTLAGSPVFATTHWSVVLKAGDEHTREGQEALEKLCRTYWFPLFAFLRRRGHDPEEAKDLTQQFFTLLLARKDLRTVAAHKGKFRTFLLTALTHFVSNERDRHQAIKRGGGQTLISLDAIPPEQFQKFEPATHLAPDKLFDQRWAITLLEQAIQQLQAEMGAAGKAVFFAQLKPFLTTEPGEGEYARVAQQLGGTSQSIAVNVHRLRQRYRELVRVEVAHTVSSPTEVEEEMRHLLSALKD